jgi:hypothetical protein
MHTIVTFESTDMLGDPRRVQMQATTLLEYAHSEGPCPRASGADNYHRWVCVRTRGRSYSMAPSSKHVDNDSETCLRVSAQLNGSELKPTESEQRTGCCRPEALVPPLWDTNLYTQLKKKGSSSLRHCSRFLLVFGCGYGRYACVWAQPEYRHYGSDQAKSIRTTCFTLL